VNTSVSTTLVVEKNVPTSVAVQRTAENKINVQGINGWTGRVSVAVVDENDPTAVESFIEVAINPLPVTKIEVAVNKSVKDQVINFNPSPSEVVRYEILVNGKKSCESTTTNCAVPQLIGPKSRVEVVAVGNDETRSVPMPIKVAYQKPVVALVVNFAVGSAALTPSYRSDLRALARVIKREGFTRIQVDGHTDTQGNSIGYNNQALSDARSRATRAFLLRLVPGLKFVTSANSYLEPAADNETPIGQFTNRRAEVKVW
jgi:outer membrane protein OmpA-like peptidoglycan-associated protein